MTIATKQAAGLIKGGGTGFLIDEDGIIATNSHVIAGADKAEIRFKDGARYSKITVLANDGLADLALLSIKLSEPDDGDEPEVAPVQLGGCSARRTAGAVVIRDAWGWDTRGY